LKEYHAEFKAAVCSGLLADAGKQYAHGIDDDNRREIDAATNAVNAAGAEFTDAVNTLRLLVP
jgi:hypothetical protein